MIAAKTSEAVKDNDGNPLPLIIGCSVGGVLLLLVIVIAVVVLIKRRRVARANKRDSRDENPIYGPRETVYVDEVK